MARAMRRQWQERKLLQCATFSRPRLHAATSSMLWTLQCPPCIELNWSELIRKPIVRIFLECSDIVYTSNTRFVESCTRAACLGEPLNGVSRAGMHPWFRSPPMPPLSRKPLFILAVLHAHGALGSHDGGRRHCGHAGFHDVRRPA